MHKENGQDLKLTAINLSLYKLPSYVCFKHCGKYYIPGIFYCEGCTCSQIPKVMKLGILYKGNGYLWFLVAGGSSSM